MKIRSAVLPRTVYQDTDWLPGTRPQAPAPRLTSTSSSCPSRQAHSRQANGPSGPKAHSLQLLRSLGSQPFRLSPQPLSPQAYSRQPLRHRPPGPAPGSVGKWMSHAYISNSNGLKYGHVFIDIICKTEDSFVDGTVRTVRFEYELRYWY